MNIFTKILDAAGGVLAAIFDLIGDAFGGVVSIFYDATANENAGDLTTIGYAMAFVVGATLVATAIYVLYNMIRRAVNRVNSGARSLG